MLIQKQFVEPAELELVLLILFNLKGMKRYVFSQLKKVDFGY